MKKKVLLSSVLTIALCLCLIAGSTFALFTNQSSFNISVTAGKIEMTASTADIKLYSAEANANGTLEDEKGNKYEYKDVTATEQFTNGGTAKFVDSVLTIDKITPGDKVSFALIGTNDSNVAIQYRYIIECVGGYKLMDGLVVTVDPDTTVANNENTYSSISKYTSPWKELGVDKNIEDVAPVEISIELPIAAGNEYQKQSTSINVIIEAIQGNAVVEDNTDPVIVEIPKVTDKAQLDAAIANPEIAAINVMADIADAVALDNISNKTIFVNGYDASFVMTGEVENVVIDGIVEKTGGNSINLKGVSEGSSVTVQNSSFISNDSTRGTAIVLGENSNLKVDNCTFTRGDSKTYAIYQSGATGSLEVTNSEFNGYTSWAIQVNNKINGDLTIDNCTFNTQDGVLKALHGCGGNFTFTNNVMNGCKGHDGEVDAPKYEKLFEISATQDNGNTVTIENNILDGNLIDPANGYGITVNP